MMSARVLIADEDPSRGPTYEEALRKLGPDLSPVLAGDWTAALERLRAGPNDLLILSASLPGIDIGEFCRLAVSGGAFPPTLLLSDEPLDRLKNAHPRLEEFFAGVLCGPRDPEALVLAVMGIVGRRPCPVGAPGGAASTSGLLGDGPDPGRGFEERRRDLELDLASKNLHLAEMEVKLEELIRLKTDFEKRAQDALEMRAAEERRLKDCWREAQTSGEAARGVADALKRELERAVVDKERLEEQLEGERQAHRKVKEELEARAREKQEQAGALMEAEASRAGEGEELKARCRRLEEENASLAAVLRERAAPEALEELRGANRGLEGQRDEARRIAEEREKESAAMRAEVEKLRSANRRLTEDLKVSATESWEGLAAGEAKAALDHALEEIERYRLLVGQLERDLAAQKGARKAMEEEFQLQLMTEREEKRELERRQREAPPSAGEAGDARLDLLKESMVEAVRAAQKEIVERARSEADLAVRLESAQREKEEALRRMENELARAGEREKRLEGMIDRVMNFDRPGPSMLPARLERARPEAPRRIGWRPGAAALLLLAAASLVWWLAFRRVPPAAVPGGKIAGATGARAPAAPGGTDAAAVEGGRVWTRKVFSGPVVIQATRRSPEELRLAVEDEGRERGWSARRLEEEWARRLKEYDFDRFYYFQMDLTCLEPGYPAWADDLYRRLFLGDGSGREVAGQMPPNVADGKVVYSRSPGPQAADPSALVYEVVARVAFPRGDLKEGPGRLQMSAYDIGLAGRRTLSWEVGDGAR